MTVRVKVWDLPLRLFHWTLVALIALQYASGEFHLLGMQWHYWLGYATLALLLFRLAWGIFGSQTARFSEFVRGPVALLGYLRHGFVGGRGPQIGHNPLGGWSALLMLACVALQTLTGLFASDDIMEVGPLAHRVSESTVALMSSLHRINQNLLLLLIALHVGAVLVHLIVKHDDLIRPMLDGGKRLEADPGLRFASARRAWILLLLSATVVAALVYWGAAPG